MPLPEPLRRLVQHGRVRAVLGHPWARHTGVRHTVAALLLMITGVAAIALVTGSLAEVRSSTGAWLLAHIHRILIAGSYPAAAVASEIPNTFYNPLYPALVAGISTWLPGDWVRGPTVVGHVVSAAALGLAALPLYALWRSVGGRAAGLVAVGALLFPPMVATASLVRYDTLAIVLVLLCAWAGWSAAQDGRTWKWAVAGLCAGLAYNTREFLSAPALGALATAWLVRAVPTYRGASDAPGRRAAAADGARGLAGAALGLAVGGVLLPVSLRLSPMGGVDALLGYAVRGEAVARPGTTLWETLYLQIVGLPLALGLVGLGVTALLRRGAARQAALVLLGTLTPFVVFLVSDQQSPQYYLAAHVLVLSGLAGLLALLPWRVARWGLALAYLAVTWSWASSTVPQLNVGQVPPRWELHTETWPAPAAEIGRIVDWAAENTGDDPLVVTSQRVENADSLFVIRHGRPAAFLFGHELESLMPRLISLYGGGEVVLFSVESHLGMHPVPPVGEELGTVGNPRVSAVLYRLPGIADGEVGSCPSHNAPRGACLQSDWNDGGEVWMRQRMLARLQTRNGLLRWRTGKPGT